MMINARALKKNKTKSYIDARALKFKLFSEFQKNSLKFKLGQLDKFLKEKNLILNLVEVISLKKYLNLSLEF